MKEKTIITAHIDDFVFDYYDRVTDKRPEIGKEKSYAEAAEDLRCSPELLEAVDDSLKFLRDLLSDDLKEMYQMIKRIQKEQGGKNGNE